MSERAVQTKELTPATTDYEVVDKICRVQRRLTPDEIATIIARFRDGGETMATLAREYGCSRKTISGHLKRAGIAARDTTCDPALVDRMITLYQDGYSLERVGAKLGVSGSTVRNYLKVRGMPLRDSHGREW